MSENRSNLPTEATAPNQSVNVGRPNDKTPWGRVEVIAEVGTECCVMHSDDDCVRILVRPPGREWPYGMEPTGGGSNTIQPGYTRFVVMEG